MKVEGVRPGPVANLRRRAAPDAVTSQAVRPADSVSIMGLSEDDLSPPVRVALESLLSEIELLRREAAELQQRLETAEALADEDVLVPVLNRRAFVRELQRAVALAHRHEVGAAVVYFDLDGFKAVNDAYGHGAGDAALRATAERLRQNVREEDVVARLGGDEFAVLLVHTDRMDAAAKAEALKAAVEDAPVEHYGAAFMLKITYGVRVLGGTDQAEQALAEADAAMFLRKPHKR